MLRSNEEKIKGHFSILLLKTESELQQKNIHVNDIQRFLTAFFQCEVIFHGNTVSELFTTMTVKRLWDYVHYFPLEMLTGHFLPDDPLITHSMREYKAYLSGYFMLIKIVDYIQYKADFTSDEEESDINFTKLTVKQYRKLKIVLQLDRKVSELSLTYVSKLWSSFREEYDLPSLPSIIDRIIDG